MKHVILSSGGLDSFITIRYVKEVLMGPLDYLEVVYVPLEHRYQEQEMQAVISTYPNTSVLVGLRDLGSLEESDANIWCRNAFLSLLAAKQIGNSYGKIWLTVQKDELSLPDRSPAFFKAMSELLKSLEINAFVDTPWWNHDKEEIVAWYLKSGGSVEELKKTHSCYSPKELPCGTCAACVRRFIAMTLNGIYEEYCVDPRLTKLGAEYVQRAKDGVYSPERCKKTLLALGGQDEFE